VGLPDDPAVCGAATEHGSAEWLALAEGSAAKVAAVVIAAEAWARDGDNLGDNLPTELDLARRAEKAAEDADYRARAAAHRQEWRHLRVIRGAFADVPEFRGEAS
jgi:hypothetical protein